MTVVQLKQDSNEDEEFMAEIVKNVVKELKPVIKKAVDKAVARKDSDNYLLNQTEVVDILDTSHATFRDVILPSGFPHIEIGNKIAFTRQGVNRWIREHESEY